MVSSIPQVPAARLLSFPKARRLTRTSDFDRVKEGGHRERGKFMVLAALELQDSGVSRAGLITSRRLGSAIVRNRTRRRLREIVRKYQHHLRQGFWIVITARSDAARASYRALEDEWLRLAKRASILAL
jgi:ribonuclease P protein component